MMKKIRIYNVITISCTNSEIEDELVHLFKGCTNVDKVECCANNNYYHDPMSVKATMEPSNSTTTVAPTTTDCDTTKDRISPTSQTPHPTTHDLTSINPSTSTAPTTSDASKNGTFISTFMESQDYDVIIITVSTIMVSMLVLILIGSSMLLHYKYTRKCICTKCTKQVSTEKQPECVYVGNPSEKSAPTVNSPHKDSKSKLPTALVIYSSNTPEREQALIRTNLISELESCRIKISSHDLTCIQGGPSAWLECETKKATVVLCVCNKEFKDDWEGRSEASLPLVQSLRHLIHGTVQSGKTLSKYAVVLLEPSHKEYIPTMYLQSDSRQFVLNDAEDIARYVLDIPSYAIPNQ